jgi:sulfite dehydrogenase (cytochrome) subunit B
VREVNVRKVILPAALVIALGTAQGKADEPTVSLKHGPGLDAVEGNCGACHSLDYIQMNSPFQDEKGWTATVNKMVKALGAPISQENQKTIIAYLSANYSK